MKRAALYARVSGDDSRKEDRNLLAQMELCRGYAAAHGYEIVVELAEDDRGASGAAFELPQLNRVRELARHGEIDLVVTRDLDRLSRRLAKQLFVEDQLLRSGVRIEYVLASYDDNAEGTLIKLVRASIAEFERLKISERTTNGRRAKVQQGNVMVGGHAPYGYRVAKENGRTSLEVDEAEAEVVRQIYAWYVDGVTIHQIQERLTGAGAPTFADRAGWRETQLKQRPAGAWDQSTIAYMLQNETYRGVWRYGKKSANGVVEVRVPAIVSDALWEQARERRTYNRENSARSMRGDYLLRRRVRCGLCGAKLEARRMRRRDREYAYYFCPARRTAKMAHNCTLPGFQVHVVDALVWGWVRELLLDPVALESGLRRLADEQAAAQAPLLARLTRADGEVARLEGEQVELAALYLRKKLPEAALDKLGAELAGQLAARRTEAADLRRQVQPATLNEARIQGVLKFAAGIAADLDLVDADFSLRRFVVEMLDVQAVLSVNAAGARTVEAALVFGDRMLPLASNATDSASYKPQQVVLRQQWQLRKLPQG